MSMQYNEDFSKYKDLNNKIRLLLDATKSIYNRLIEYRPIEFALESLVEPDDDHIITSSESIDELSVRMFDFMQKLESKVKEMANVIEEDPRKRVLEFLAEQISDYLRPNSYTATIYSRKVDMAFNIYKWCIDKKKDILCKKLEEDFSPNGDRYIELNNIRRDVAKLLSDNVDILQKIIYMWYLNKSNINIDLKSLIEDISKSVGVSDNIIKRINTYDVDTLDNILRSNYIDVRLPTEDTDEYVVVLKISLENLKKPEDIGGYKNIKYRLYSVINYFNNEIANKEAHTMVLYGPSGVGKTILVESFVNNVLRNGINIGYIRISSFESLQETVSVVKIIRRKTNSPLIIHIMEGEEKIGKDTTGILRIIEDLNKIYNSIIIIEINYAENISPRSLNRFKEQIYVGGVEEKEFEEVIDKIANKYNYKIDQDIMRYIKNKLYTEYRTSLLVTGRLLDRIVYNLSIRDSNIDKKSLIDNIILGWIKQYSPENKNIKEIDYNNDNYSTLSM